MLWCESVAPFGKPVVPDVYWMLIGSSKRQLGLALGEPVVVDVAAALGEVAPGLLADVDDVLQARAVVAHALDHAAVVGRLVRTADTSSRMPDWFTTYASSCDAVGRVDVHQDRADLRRRVLQQHPLRAVRRPDADPVTLLDPAVEQAAGRARRPRRRARCRSSVGASATSTSASRSPQRSHRALEVGADRLAEQRGVGRRGRVRGSSRGSRCRHGVILSRRPAPRKAPAHATGPGCRRPRRAGPRT